MPDYQIQVMRNGVAVSGAEVIAGDLLYGTTNSDGRVTETTRGRTHPIRVQVEVNGSGWSLGTQVTLRPDRDSVIDV